jgi:hypothetical protein
MNVKNNSQYFVRGFAIMGSFGFLERELMVVPYLKSSCLCP